MKKIVFLPLFLLLGCVNDLQTEATISDADSIDASITVRPFIEATGTKTAARIANFVFDQGSSIGIIPHDLAGMGTEGTSQLRFYITGTDDDYTAHFNSGVGWSLMTNGQYNYIAYYPYSEDYINSRIPLNFAEQRQSANDDLSHTYAYDILYSDPVLPVSSSSAGFFMNHLCALVKLVITVPEEYGNTAFTRITLQTDENILVNNGFLNMGTIVSDGSPSFSPSEYSDLLSLSLNDIIPADNIITAYLMMYPADLNGKNLTLKLWSTHKNLCLSGTATCEEDQEQGHTYTYNIETSSTGPQALLPDAPKDGDNLNILLIGHSFGIDATEYLPALMDAAGIDNVNIGRFYWPNCSLATHWDYYENDTAYPFHYSAAGTTTYSILSRTLKSVILETPWDIVVFQQSIASDAGNYATYQPYLDNLVFQVLDKSIEKHGKLPFIGWHMFWGSGDGGYATMFANIKTATKAMMADTGIRLIIPTGTAIDLIRTRNESYTNAEEQVMPFSSEIYDHHHCGRGVGRYVCACTWFESIIKPIYKISVVGNTYRQLEEMANERDCNGRVFYAVDDTKAPLLQAIAAEAAANPGLD